MAWDTLSNFTLLILVTPAASWYRLRSSWMFGWLR